MNVCLLGKYPPIEGGVSANTYWLARGLAARGHHVHVVTNADEVEGRYRLTLGSDDAEWYQPCFEHGGRVVVHNTEPFSRYAMGHIPLANPFVSKLAALGTDIVRRHDCDVILAYYYEPYAIAGSLVSRWTDRSLVTKHAGSDLDRLFRVPDLATSYREMLLSASAVVTQPHLMPRFLGLGVERQQLERDVPYWLPADVFSPDGEVLQLPPLAIPMRNGGDRITTAVDARAPVIGILGKIGITKGTFDLIAALGRLAREGRVFRFAAMIGREQGESLLPALDEAGITDLTYCIPMLPNWRVPAFMRACTVVCFLERDFPIAIHGPVIPREVLACGVCLMLSEEIAAKQRYRGRLVSGENVLIVADPKDHDGLAGALRAVLDNPPHARAVGARGLEVSKTLERHDDYIGGWEALLARHVRRVRAPAPADHTAAIASTPPWFEWVLPDLLPFLRGVCPELGVGFRSPPDAHPFEAAMRFCEHVAEELAHHRCRAQAPRLVAVVSYAQERLRASYSPPHDSTPVFPVVDQLHGAKVSRESVWHLLPVRGTSTRIVSFDYDVSGAGILATIGGHEPLGDNGADLETAERGPILVLFHRSANLIRCELRVEEPTRQLVERCDGTRTTREVVGEMCQFFGVEPPGLTDEVEQRVLGALDRLYRAGVVVFGERRNGWGWSGGARSAIDQHGAPR